MKRTFKFLFSSTIGGLLVIAPLYLLLLLLAHGIMAVAEFVKPIVSLLPGWFPGETLIALLLVLLVCLCIGIVVRTTLGSAFQTWIEKRFLERIPGYSLLRNLTRQVAGDKTLDVWRPAMVELEGALVLGFIIEEFEDGRYTIFVPEIPTPLTGAVFVMENARVHPLDISFAAAIKTISRWGEGTKDLIAAMNTRPV